MQLNNLAPLWDEGIQAMLSTEFERKQKPLDIVDLQTLAVDHATRIGDIMETLFLMAVYGDWNYTTEGGETQAIDQAALDDLYSRGRLGADDLKTFDGVWTPVS